MDKGFTLVELLIVMAVSGIIMTGVYSAFKTQQDSYLAQEQIAEMQQNIRAGLDVMTRDMRMAGYDPGSTGNYGIITATAGQLVFDLDDPENPGTPVIRTFEVYTTGLGVDALRRKAGGTAIAENIEKLEFLYLDREGNVTTTLADIRSIRISILARARQPDRNYTNTESYTSASGEDWTPTTKVNYRRRFQITTVNLRNMGM